jgi:hypothetical protein
VIVCDAEAPVPATPAPVVVVAVVVAVVEEFKVLIRFATRFLGEGEGVAVVWPTPELSVEPFFSLRA